MPMPHATTASPWRHEEFCLTPQETTKPILRLRRNGRVGILSGQAEIFELKPGLEMGEI